MSSDNETKQATIPGTDTTLSKACSEFLVAKSKMGKAREAAEAASAELLRSMAKAGKSSLRHGRLLFSVQHREAKETIAVREV